MVSLKTIKSNLLEYGLAIMLLGLVIYAIGHIIDYIITSVTGISYIQIRFIVLVGMCIIVIGAGLFIYVIKGENLTER